MSQTADTQPANLLFTKEIESKLDQLSNDSDEIYKVLESSIAVNFLNKQMITKEFNLSTPDVDRLDEIKTVNIGFSRKILATQMLFVVCYCSVHTRTLLKNGRGIKSFKCWLGGLGVIYATICWSLVSFRRAVKTEIDSILTQKYFGANANTEEIIDSMNFLKKMRFIDSKIKFH